jgi:hypothetical protein
MSEFKFACPVCGQHIRCDSSHTGATMDCPTCFQKITVPQAPTGDQQKFILTGSKLSPKTVYAKRPPSVIPLKRFPGARVVLLILFFMGAAAAAIYWLTVIHPRHAATPGHHATPAAQPGDGAAANASPRPEPPPAIAPPASDANWKLELDASPIPDTPVAGRIHGQDFIAERAIFQNGAFTLRAGTRGPTDFGVTVNFGGVPAETLSGKTIQVASRALKDARVTLHWKDDRPQKRDYHDGYAMRLEFGPLARNRLPGKIYLCLPDAEKSYVLGSFNATVSQPKPRL